MSGSIGKGIVSKLHTRKRREVYMKSEIFNLSADSITSGPEILMIGGVGVPDSRGEDRSEIGMNEIIDSSPALESVLMQVS